MRKTTITKIAIKDPSKKATIFKAKRVIQPLVTGQQTIDKAVETMKNEDKEQELLKRELEKPMKQRNKALMEKYGVLDGSKLTDNYPDLNKNINYELEIYLNFPEDDGVDVQKRPKPWWVGMTIEYEGNKFNYRFPIHVDTYHDGQNLYKLDGFAVYVDKDGVIKNDISEYTIFQALTDYQAGTLRDGLVNDIFYKYKIISANDVDDDIISDKVQKNFAIKGHYLFVTSKVIKTTFTKNTTNVTSGDQLKQSFIEDPHVVITSGTAADLTLEVNRLINAGGIVVPGLTKKLPDGVLNLTGYGKVTSSTTNTPRYVILYHAPTTPNVINFAIMIGPSLGLSAAKSIDSKVTKVDLINWIVENNKSAYNLYMGDIAAEEKRKADLAEAQRIQAKQIADALQAAKDKQAAAAQKIKDDAAKKAKDDADKQAKADADKKARDEAAQKLADAEKALFSRLDGELQVLTFDTPVKAGSDKGGYSDAEGKAIYRACKKVQKRLKREDGVVIAGIKQRIGRSFQNKITKIVGEYGDTGDWYVALIEPFGNVGDEELRTVVYIGLDAVRYRFNMPTSSDSDIIDTIVQHNNKVFNYVMKRK